MCYDISQCHGAGAYTDIYFKGTQFRGTKFGKFSKFNTVDIKNRCPWNFRGFMMN